VGERASIGREQAGVEGREESPCGAFRLDAIATFLSLSSHVLRPSTPAAPRRWQWQSPRRPGRPARLGTGPGRVGEWHRRCSPNARRISVRRFWLGACGGRARPRPIGVVQDFHETALRLLIERGVERGCKARVCKKTFSSRSRDRPHKHISVEFFFFLRSWHDRRPSPPRHPPRGGYRRCVLHPPARYTHRGGCRPPARPGHPGRAPRLSACAVVGVGRLAVGCPAPAPPRHGGLCVRRGRRLQCQCRPGGRPGG